MPGLLSRLVSETNSSIATGEGGGKWSADKEGCVPRIYPMRPMSFVFGELQAGNDVITWLPATLSVVLARGQMPSGLPARLWKAGGRVVEVKGQPLTPMGPEDDGQRSSMIRVPA